MKIGQAQHNAPQLIERMQKAHAEVKDSPKATSFSLQAPSRAAQSPAASPVERSIMDIARRVMSGDIKGDTQTRRHVLEAIVDDRFSGMVEAGQKKQTLEMLEYTLGEDPAFGREIDDMLILAARSIANQDS